MAALNEQGLEKLISEAVREVMAQGGRGQKIYEAAVTKKPETMTHLRGNVLVKKTHPLIALRGEIDSLEAEIIVVQQVILRQGILGFHRIWKKYVNLFTTLLNMKLQVKSFQI